MALKLAFAVLLCVIPHISGHGYLSIPPARNYCGALKDKGPCVRNWTPNELNCGGFVYQWREAGGKCGVCGDPYGKTQRHTEGGEFAKGVITGRYKKGQEITVEVTVTANHLGWFEFRVGDIGTPPITEEKLSYVLTQKDGSKRWKLTNPKTGKYKITLQLPSDLMCKRCVLRWWWNTGNSWGCDDEGCGLGHGAQESFVNCADISIE